MSVIAWGEEECYKKTRKLRSVGGLRGLEQGNHKNKVTDDNRGLGHIYARGLAQGLFWSHKGGKESGWTLGNVSLGFLR